MKTIILALIFITNLYSSSTEKLGDALRIVLPTVAIGSTFYFKDQEGRNQFYKSFVTTTALTYALKYSVKKERPNNQDNHSFPSGHTSIAFQGATFIHQRYGLRYGILAYLAAGYTGYSRVHSNNHDLEDVLAGALIGSLSAYVFTSKSSMHFKPLIAADSYGLSIASTW